MELWQVLHAAAHGDVAALGDFNRSSQRIRPVCEKARHLGRAFQVRLTVAAALHHAGVQSGMAADCSQHVVQPVTGPLGVVDVVGRHHRRVHPLGHPQQSLHQPLVARMELALKLHKKAVLAKAGLQVLGNPQCSIFVPGQ